MKKSDVLDACDLHVADLRARLVLLKTKTSAHLQSGRVGAALEYARQVSAALQDIRVNEPKGGE